MLPADAEGVSVRQETLLQPRPCLESGVRQGRRGGKDHGL
jgi:hypothetical protein